MNKWDTLRELCPRLFKQRIAFECAAGWYKIIHDLSLKIERILEKDAEIDVCPEGEENQFIEMYAVQIKEKYGTLRFYMSWETAEISELITQAKALSSRMCECCGESAKIRCIPWFSVICESCFGELK